MKLLTFTEAAAFAGVSVKTIHKHVKLGKIETVDSPFGRRIAESVLTPYREFWGTKGNTQEPLVDTEETQSLPIDTAQEQLGAPESNRQRTGENDRERERSVPLEAHLAALAFAERRILEAQAQLEKERDKAALAGRMQLALEMTLRQHQTVLGEQAESLAEERARRLQSEARLECVPEVFSPDERDELETESRRLQEQFEADRAELTEKLRLTQSKVEWMEQRVPRWVRKLFRAG